jgi:aldehyde:ferredoxin oxidoreductase
MSFGDWESAARLLDEIEKETPLGLALANGVATTAQYFNINRISAYKGQALPAHDPRSVKGTGVTNLIPPCHQDETMIWPFPQGGMLHGKKARFFRRGDGCGPRSGEKDEGRR